MFGTVANPVRMMMQEHDGAGDALRSLRSITNDYALPEDACISYRTLFGALEGFEADLHQHIHLKITSSSHVQSPWKPRGNAADEQGSAVERRCWVNYPAVFLFVETDSETGKRQFAHISCPL